MVKGKHQYDLSEEYILECTDTVLASGTTDDCTGGDIGNSLQVVTSNGIPLEKTYSYQAGTYKPAPATNTHRLVVLFQIMEMSAHPNCISHLL